MVCANENDGVSDCDNTEVGESSKDWICEGGLGDNFW